MQKTKTEYNLLEARKEALNQVANGSIRPHGKLWGMDVFSWENPNVETIASTIHSFPFPIVWLGDAQLLTTIVEHDASVLSNIHAVVSYDGKLDTTTFQDVELLSEQTDVQQALQKMNEFRLKRGVVLFCHSGIDSEFYKNAFKTFLGLHQI